MADRVSRNRTLNVAVLGTMRLHAEAKLGPTNLDSEDSSKCLGLAARSSSSRKPMPPLSRFTIVIVVGIVVVVVDMNEVVVILVIVFVNLAAVTSWSRNSKQVGLLRVF
jgi:hypothetical protein